MKLIQPRFEIKFLQEARDFLATLDAKTREKIIYNAKKSAVVMDNELFKKLEGSEIWEFRTLYNKNYYRLLAFWDTDNDSLVIATHGIIKKTGKTPTTEISKAEELRKKYFDNKNK